MIKRLLYLLTVLVEQVQQWQRNREAVEAQKARDAMEDDISDWYEHHFGGMPDDNAGKADKADPDTR